MRDVTIRSAAVSAVVMLVLLSAPGAWGHEISFDRSTIRTDDFVSLTITLEGAFTGVENVRLSLQNLVLVAGPSTSTEFRWVNGETSRRKVLTYRLRPREAGVGAVGPVVLTAPNGDQLTLKRVTVRVIDPVQGRGSEEGTVSLGRLPTIVAEVSKTRAWVGEQIEIRWSLYGENIRGVQLLELPSIDGFWVEQIDTDQTTREVLRIGDELIQRQTLRHSLLYPLRAGTYEIAPLAASVRVYRRDPFGDLDGWNPFGGSVREVTRQSERLRIEVVAPPNPELPVGTFDLRCSDPRVPSSGPIAIDLQLAGSANLRAIEPPEFTSSPSAGVELEPMSISLQERDDAIVMQRGWRYLMFPKETGDLAIPPLEFSFFDPESESVRSARCGGWTIAVRSTAAVASSEERDSKDADETERRSLLSSYWVPGSIAAVGLALLVALVLTRPRRDRGASRLLNLIDDPVELRRELDDWLVRHGYHAARLRSQKSEIGEAWRSVSSLLDLVEREPWELERSRDELRRRLRDLIDDVTRR